MTKFKNQQVSDEENEKAESTNDSISLDESDKEFKEIRKLKPSEIIVTVVISVIIVAVIVWMIMTTGGSSIL